MEQLLLDFKLPIYRSKFFVQAGYSMRKKSVRFKNDCRYLCNDFQAALKFASEIN